MSRPSGTVFLLAKIRSYAIVLVAVDSIRGRFGGTESPKNGGGGGRS